MIRYVAIRTATFISLTMASAMILALPYMA